MLSLSLLLFIAQVKQYSWTNVTTPLPPPKKKNLLWILICIFEQIHWDYTPSSSPTSNPVNSLMRINRNCKQGALCFERGAGSGLPGRSEGALANHLNTGHPFSHNRTQLWLWRQWHNLASPYTQVGTLLVLTPQQHNSAQGGHAEFLPQELQEEDTKDIADPFGFSHSLHGWIHRVDLQMFWESLLIFSSVSRSRVQLGVNNNT